MLPSAFSKYARAVFSLQMAKEALPQATLGPSLRLVIHRRLPHVVLSLLRVPSASAGRSRPLCLGLAGARPPAECGGARPELPGFPRSPCLRPCLPCSSAARSWWTQHVSWPELGGLSVSGSHSLCTFPVLFPRITRDRMTHRISSLFA